MVSRKRIRPAQTLISGVLYMAGEHCSLIHIGTSIKKPSFRRTSREAFSNPFLRKASRAASGEPCCQRGKFDILSVVSVCDQKKRETNFITCDHIEAFAANSNQKTSKLVAKRSSLFSSDFHGLSKSVRQ